MLTLGDETWLLWLVTSAVAMSFVALLASCICGCRKTVPKNELMGLAGMVKITNPEESLNHNVGDRLACEVVPCTEATGGRSCSDGADANRRTSTTANRSLPDIPIDSERVNLDSGDTLWETNEPNGDTCSELYATVEENKTVSQPSVSMQSSRGGKLPVSATSDDGKSSEHSSLSQTDDSFSPYAQLKSEHPYDQLKKSEHPYAQVGSSSDRSVKPDTLTGPVDVDKTNPVPPPRTRKSNSSNSLTATQDTSTLASTSANIPAATAIAGRISASQELPYMTPPIPTPAMVPDPQLHFSGDSQDSSKGYTSISVREPLANIKAQTRQRSRTQELSDSLYASVSDDSEEMYAAIEEPGPVYTSGSETYAQIQPPTVVAEPIAVATVEAVETPHNPPQPPSVDSLKQVAHVHSRQASSSSAASSVTNLGSPKPEKRQANSPLPPPPAGSPELYATVDKKRDQSLEEMYAKVVKKKQKGLPDSLAEPGDQEVSLEVDAGSTTSSRESMDARVLQQTPDSDNSTSSSNPNLHFDISRKEPTRSFPLTNSVQTATKFNCLDEFSSIPYIDPGYEVVQRGPTNPPSDSDPNYEELYPQGEPGYASITRDASLTVPGYASIGATRDASLTVPGYASIGATRDASLTVPGYESIDASRDKSTTLPGYESIDASRDRSTTLPGYESIDASRDRSTTLPGYESIDASRDRSTTLPGYESIDASRDRSTTLPGYESINASRDRSSTLPGYESIDASRDRSTTLPGYESIDASRDRSTTLSGYESINASRDRSSTLPGYESIGRLRGRSLAGYESIGSRPDPGYETVQEDKRRSKRDSNGSEERNYESPYTGSESDPNYESVNYCDLPRDPPYERLQDSENERQDTEYEEVDVRV